MNLAGNESRSTQSGMGGVSSSKSQKEMFTCSVWGGGPVGPGAESDIVLWVICVWECVPLHNKTDPVNYGRPVMSMIQPSYLLYNRSLRCGGRSTFVERGCERDGGAQR